jgi:TolB-like protein
MRNLLLVMPIIALLLVGCGTKGLTESFLREDVDFSFVQRIAVLPFQNNSGDTYAAVRARNITITNVFSSGLFDVVEKDLVDSALRDEVVTSKTEIEPLTLKRLGGRLRVQAFLLGTIDMAGSGKIGAATFPQFGLTLRLLEAESGSVLWQASGYNNAESFSNRLFGIKGDDNYQLTAKLVKSLLRTLDI